LSQGLRGDAAGGLGGIEFAQDGIFACLDEILVFGEFELVLGFEEGDLLDACQARPSCFSIAVEAKKIWPTSWRRSGVRAGVLVLKFGREGGDGGFISGELLVEAVPGEEAGKRGG